MTLCCSDFESAPPCCTSCHNERNAGYGGSLSIPGDEDGEVCCNLSTWLQGMPEDKRDDVLKRARAHREREVTL